MMKSIKTTLLLAIVGILVISSCKKYEEGPGLSFRSRTERIANTWVIDKYYISGEDYTDFFTQQVEIGYTLTLKKDGYANIKSTSGIYNPPMYTDYTGTWELADNDKNLKIIYTNNVGNEIVREYEIIKLKEKELWTRIYSSNGSDYSEFHFKPQ